mmetsp:Transcript_33576/g.76782  ORF Transcript_33576/g.76782 Transcript_33576/m.76782 type:complete len:328 (+) Transcript_33576:122-1105(+)|eukprot:CAMPEP_0114544532 /NCGR_PEP_ID=MMETSP0114-20121206/2927_1 /TAXON_ID=31324 /ORGANISM="Goniomonas sp, Strain m" /LENGTH=327 /DNA_ID=CAMNT_0001728919 /DNA_START=55 /DNA_END=1038 /DNA_ORIENTATION=-
MPDVSHGQLEDLLKAEDSSLKGITVHGGSCPLEYAMFLTFDYDMCKSILKVMQRDRALSPQDAQRVDAQLGNLLLTSADHGSLKDTSLLLQFGAPVNTLNGREELMMGDWSVGGRTALHFAARAGETDSVNLLLQHGADPDIIDESGLTPWDLAVQEAFSGLLSSSGVQRRLDVAEVLAPGRKLPSPDDLAVEPQADIVAQEASARPVPRPVPTKVTRRITKPDIMDPARLGRIVVYASIYSSQPQQVVACAKHARASTTSGRTVQIHSEDGAVYNSVAAFVTASMATRVKPEVRPTILCNKCGNLFLTYSEMCAHQSHCAGSSGTV